MPLEGLSIVDLSGWLTGAGATGMLADLGADVIKVEQPGVGDASRGMQLSRKEAERRVLILYELANRNKRSIAIDLKKTVGRDVFLRLVARVDVVTENFRRGTMERLGLSYGALAEVNPQIILASASGFGQRGPHSTAWVTDPLGHSRSGLLRLLSDPDRPLRYIGPHAIADQTGAILFTQAILLALVARMLHGRGQHVDVSQLSALMCLQTNPLHVFLATGEQPWRDRRYYGNPTALGRIYECRDGNALYLTAGEHWRELCDVLGRADLVDDPRFADSRSRQQHDRELAEELALSFRKVDCDATVDTLLALGVPASKVQDYEDLARDPQVTANGYITEVDHPTAGRLRQLAPPFGFSYTKPKHRFPAPRLGQHTDEIMRDAGYSDEEIAILRESGAVA